MANYEPPDYDAFDADQPSDDVRDPHPFGYVTSQQIQDLWGIGYTIVKRQQDPFDLPQHLIPHGKAYQWNSEEPKFRIGTSDSNVNIFAEWLSVPHERHPGIFGPIGMTGAIEVGGLWLCEKPKREVDAERAKKVAAAQNQTDDWVKRTGTEFIGSYSVDGQRTSIGVLGDPVFDFAQGSTIDAKTKSIETTTAIPRELTPYIAQIRAERDRLIREDTLRGVTGMSQVDFTAQQRAKWMPQAIENIRKRITEEADSGQTS